VGQGEIPLTLYVYGEDSGRILTFLENAVRQCLGNSVREFNYNHLDGRATPMGRVIETAQTVPVLSKWRVVLVTNSDAFGKNDWVDGLSYLQDPSPSTFLIFRGEKPSAPKEVIEAIKARGAILEFRPRSEKNAERWLTDHVRREHKRIHTEAVRALIERVGTREGDLEQEINKIITYIGEDDTITEDHVNELCVEARTHRVFDLTDALIEKRSKDALRILHRLLEGGSSPLGLIGLMARQVRLIWIARELSGAGKGILEWPRGLSIPQFLKNRLLKQAKKWDEGSLEKAFEGLIRIDKALKRGRLNPEILLDRWVLTLGHPSDLRSAGGRSWS
jgi:DNA polymerase-3 subunit delta